MTIAPMSGLHIRRAKAEDAALLAAFGTRTFLEAFGAMNTPEDAAAHVAKTFSDAKQRAEIDAADSATLLAECDGVLQGYAQLRRWPAPKAIPFSQPVEVMRFYLDAPAQGRGVAQALMASTLKAARALGGDALWLSAWTKNPRAIAFYTRQRFTDHGALEFWVGNDCQQDRLLVRDLALGAEIP